MENETKYEIIELNAPIRKLIKISGNRELIASLDAFGPGYFNSNIAEMQKSYSHPQTREIITFQEPTTAESVLVAAYDFEDRAKPKIFGPLGLQAGRILKASEWVIVNTPRDKQGNLIEDERTLKRLLNGVKKSNGIYRIPNRKIKGVRDCSFVPHESFRSGFQSGEDFARSGIARGLEYVEGDKAPKLEIISTKINYPNGVCVFGFDPENVMRETSRIVSLFSGGYLGDWLNIDGYYWDGGDYSGYVFGVLNESAEGDSQKNK